MSAPRLVMGLLQCLPLELMTSEYNVVMPMDVHVHVRLELEMMARVTRWITKAFICIDSDHPVANLSVHPTISHTKNIKTLLNGIV